MRRLTVAWVLGLSAISSPALSQIHEVSLDARIDEAALIVEATVITSASFWNPDRTRILTAHRLQVHKVLKIAGKRLDEVAQITLLTLGGRVDDHWHDVRPSLGLRPGESGLFFVEQRGSFAGLSDVWLAVGGPQGFIRYDEFTGVARDPFRTYPDLQSDLYEPIRERTGQPLSVVSELAQNPPSNAQRGGLATITGFSPNPVSGGVQQVLTIDGSGFGATFSGLANVFFDNPDDGPGGSFAGITSSHVVFWSDSQIQVHVPSGAGTGSFIVREPSGSDAVSPSSLTVDYALREIVSTNLERIFQEDEDDRGGYTFLYSTATANGGVDFSGVTDAVARFAESLETWNCAVGWTAGVDGTTTIAAAANDGANVVAFDNGADALPGGVLGRATSYYTGCAGDWHLDEIDIRFRRDGSGVDWFFGADTGNQLFGEHDFMSVAIHELGHAVQHGHINNSGDVMFWSIANGTNRRTLTAANIAGGQDILAYSDGRVSACATGMRTFACNTAPTARFTAAPRGTCGTSLAVDFTDLSYDGPTSWTWTFGDATGSSARNPAHTYTSTGVYDVALNASNASGSDLATADDLIIVTNPPTTAACDATFSAHNPTGNMGPTRVTLNTIDHSTASSQFDPLYDDYSCARFTVLEPGMSYPISVTTGGTNDEAVRVYIDWNDDGTLAASELVLDSTLGGDVHNGTVNVPASPTMDTALRLRVLSDWVFSDPISDPCENIEYGQVEDYSVLVRQPAFASPGRIADNSLRVNKTVTTSLDLTWGASCSAGATDYSVYQGTLGDWTSHTQKVCSTGGNTFRTVGPGTLSRYYLVVPVSASGEGSYGTNSDSIERPVGLSPCSTPQDATVCP